ncbi:MAG: 30S ribosomal protein S6 [Bacteroidota bacterium]|nr:30S ribosomal protein S6 [Bacteroidota bacterium]MDP4232789.1 30S ribosomal protein S6 [Bacteroidota bacterium]MDP4242530.1 30S ribosomal protein S6 [Bacteroidota bacterium]MDP4288891.1 30S ribosomal protein S6 [Bacteroidota bacterium]
MAENKRYESTVIVKGSLQDEQIDATISKIEDFIAKNGGAVIEMERWGRRKLAYEIGRETQGFYVSAHFTAPGGMITRLERMYDLDDNIIRWLTLVTPESAIKGRIAMIKRAEEVHARREAAALAAGGSTM